MVFQLPIEKKIPQSNDHFLTGTCLWMSHVILNCHQSWTRIHIKMYAATVLIHVTEEVVNSYKIKIKENSPFEEATEATGDKPLPTFWSWQQTIVPSSSFTLRETQPKDPLFE